MSQARRALVALISVIAVMLGFAPAAFAQAAAVHPSVRATSHAASSRTSSTSTRAQENTPGPGYWLVASDGGVFSNGAADFHGSTGAIALNQPIVGIAATPSGNGYWMVASDGGIFSFGDAAFHGSTGAMSLNKPIVGMASTPSGDGYWLVASDGGIFSFGDAAFHGSTGAIALNKPIVGMTSSPTGHGYWMVASDGGIFAFGDAAFHGSTGAMTLNKPITGIASTPTGHGYWMVASDGGIFAFGDAHFFGSTGALSLNMPIVGMASSPSGNGYWFVAADGGVFAFGDAHFFGAASATQALNAAIVGMAASAPLVPAGPIATSLEVTTDPSDATGGVDFATQPKVTIRDDDGNTVTDATNMVTLSIAFPPAGTVLTCDHNTVAAVAGVASFSGCSINKAGSYTLHAVSGDLSPSTTSVTITVGAAARLGFVQQPSGATSLVPLATQPHVAVQDLGGNTVTSDTSAITLSITTPAGAVLACTSANPLAAVAGVASFTGCNIDKSGTYTLHAVRVAAGLTPATSSPLSITAAAATHIVFSTQPSPTGSTGGAAFAVQPVVTVRDASDNTVTNDASSVVLSITQPSDPVGAAISCTSTGGLTKAVVLGVATFGGCKIDLASTTTYTLHAVDAALPAINSGTVVVGVGAASKLGFTTQPSASTGGTAFGTQPAVAVQDAGGNTVTTATGTATLTLTTPAGAVLACTTSNGRVVAAGVAAAFAGCAIDLAGTYTLTATGTGGTIGALTGVSASTVITVGAASRLGFTPSPSASTGGTAFGTQPGVTTQDAGGNTVTTATGTATLTITTPAGAVLTCTTSNDRTVTAGVAAAFAGCAIDLAGTYTLTATGTGGTIGALTGTSSTFAITVGVASKLGFTTQPSDSTGGIAFAPNQPQVAVQDAGGNTVTTATGTATLTITTPAGAVLTCTTSNGRTVTAGVAAAFAGCAIDLAGTYTLTATGTGGTIAALTGVSGATVISAGIAASATFSTPPSGAAITATPFAQSPSVTVRDAGGNLVPDGGSVTLSLNGAVGVLTCTSTLVVATIDGVSAFTGCQISAGGTYTLTATDGAATVTSGDIVVT